MALLKRKFVLGCFALLIAATGALAPVIGTDFFPTSDVGILKMHVRAPRGIAARGNREDRGPGREDDPRDHPGEGAAHHQLARIGLPFSLNLAFVPSDNISGMNAEMLISLNKGHKPIGRNISG